MESLKQAALNYADDGWHVFPVHYVENGICSCGQPCKTPGKHPMTPRGFYDATTDPEQIERWWSAHPNANIGVRTGKASNLWVLDIDAKRSVDLGGGVLVSEGEHTLRTLERRAGVPLPETLVSRTGGGGTHILFTFPKSAEDFTNRVRVAPSIDIRGEAGYIVAPPSIHASGKRYEWENPGTNVADPPHWLLTLQQERQAESFREEEEVGEGGRNDYLFRYGSKLRGEGRDDDEIAALIHGQNQLVCHPPLDTYEVVRIINNVLKQDVNPEEPTVVWESDEVPELDDGDIVAISFRELIDNPPPPRVPLISDGILDQGDGFVLAGPPNVGKSWLALDLAMAVATGEKWLNHFETTQGPVLYIDEEAGRTSDYERITKIAKARGVLWASVPLYLVTMRGIKLDSPKGYAQVARLIDRHKPSLVIMDAMIRFHGGEENSNKEMAAFFEQVNRLRSAYGVATMFLHHVRKPSKDEPGDLIDLMRGASDIKGWPDGVLMAMPNHNDMTGTGIVVTHAKSRNHAKLTPFEVGVIIDNLDNTAAMAVRGMAVTETLSVPERRDQMVKLIRDLQVKTPVTVDLIAGRMGLSTRTAEGHLKVLVADGRVFQSSTQTGTTYMAAPDYTQKGMGT